MNKLDEKALELLEVIKKKKEEVEKVSKPSYKTNMTFYFPEQGKHVNLNVVNDDLTLVKYYAYIKDTIKQLQEAAKELNVDADIKLEGFTIDEWKEDFLTKINVINVRKLKLDLKQKEDALNKLVSEDKRKELELALIERELLK